ncbi:transporter substrate-binding domain-containing protein [Enterococcus sp. PF-2]|jgi:cystine transport system substrate-binding protein|uniref:transporter substrate-binding domain-containing protein n=1 Tax=unclassified Enterococcus TaxID=2608891 RepID=UPI000C781F19|nr:MULTISPECIES: transporter substrate-binding domain-containing protein [unclassified Enterococcus]AUJ86468.1 ABC transporter substrate-binding protein [Enterococcus sp. CR-Ec1]TPE04809.1 transporter substrate-binding domain-containing protein [Enterococcus sp. PF-3]TPE23360.1 transporter substrate-binding domain-containing protein [Enterococcus sp. PF-2]
MKQVRKGKIVAMVGFLGLFAGVLLSACSKPTEEDTSLSKVEEAKTLVVATSGTLYPSSYYNDENELVGYDVDVAKEVAKRLGVEITFKEYNVDGQVSSLTRGEADFAANDFGLTDERAEKFSLSTPIKYSFDSMIVRKSDDSGIASLEDLDGKKAAGEPNTSYMRLAESYGAELVTYDNATNDQYLTDVANGRTDVILNDYYLQKMAVAALPDIPVKILEDVYFNPNETGFLFLKDHKALQEKVDAVLAEMKEDGRLKELAETYFQTDISVKSDQAIQTVETD